MRKVRLNLVNSHPRSIDCTSDKLLFAARSVAAVTGAFLPVWTAHPRRPPPPGPAFRVPCDIQHFSTEGTLELLSSDAWCTIRNMDLQYRSGVGGRVLYSWGSLDRGGISWKLGEGGNVIERRGRRKCKEKHGRSTCWEIREAGCWGKWWSLEQWMLRYERIPRTASQQDFCSHLLHPDYACPAHSSVNGRS